MHPNACLKFCMHLCCCSDATIANGTKIHWIVDNSVYGIAPYSSVNVGMFQNNEIKTNLYENELEAAESRHRITEIGAFILYRATHYCAPKIAIITTI